MSVVSTVRRSGLFLAWAIALIGTAASLVFQYGLGYQPCTLCWYQRIALYPLVVILGIAVYRDDGGVRRYALPLSIIGLCVALYQYLEQMVPGIARLAPCRTGVPCSGRDIDVLGFITIPLLSIAAFALVTLFLAAEKKYETASE
jgi:disulfide bond formation protein DsbB